MADYTNLSSIKSVSVRENETSSERDKRKYLVCAKRKKRNHWHNNEVIVNVCRMNNYRKCHLFLSLLLIKVCCVSFV